MTFRDVKIPVGNVIGEIGKGLKYALTILNIGRAISIPAICLGMAKQAWQPTLDHANTRYTFQKALAERQTQQMRIGRMAADLFAMEALAQLVWHLADQHRYDIRIEAAIAKLFCSERTIQFLKDAQIIFGGMGYETADSKRFRGAPGFGIEQLVRDAEMYRIGEGATDILRPFVAREGLNRHLERARTYFDEPTTGRRRLMELWKLFRFYVPWYVEPWRNMPLPARHRNEPSRNPSEIAVCRRSQSTIGTSHFVCHGHPPTGVRDDQGRQNRIEMAGEYLLTIAATSWYAERLERTAGHAEAWGLADEIFYHAQEQFEKPPENSSAMKMGFSQISGNKLPTASTLFSPRASSSATSMIFYPSLVEAQKGWTKIGCLSAGLLSLKKNSMGEDPKFSNDSFRRECPSLGALT